MTKISDLTTGPAITGAEEVPARVDGSNFKYSWSQVLTYVQATYGANVGTFLATPNSANLRAALTDETGTGALVFGTSPALTTPALGAATATTINGNTFTTGTYTLTGGTSKTLTFNNSLTLAGTDGTTLTFPTTNAAIARTDAGQTFTGTNAFGVLTATSINGLAVTATSGGATINIGSGAVFTVTNTLTLGGTNGTTMTFPTTSATLARTDAGNTFTGTQNLASLTITSAVATDASKNLVSVTNTGTGNNVLATSPALTTPNIGAATATTVAFSPTTGGIIGTATNDSTGVGNVGEYIESVIAVGGAVAITSATAKTITSISLTAGDWDVSALGYILPAATTNVIVTIASISGATNTLDSTAGKVNGFTTTGVVTGGSALSQVIPPYRMSLSGTTSVFLVCQATFTVSTASAYGIIRARRVR